MHKQHLRWLAGLGLALLVAWLAAPGGPRAGAQTVPAAQLYLPLVWDQVGAEGLVAAPTLRVTEPPPPTLAPSATATELPPPTDTPTTAPTATDTPPPTPTQKPAATGKITGKLTSKGAPLRFFGETGPWIELRRRTGGGPWVKVANAISDGEGAFAFENPEALRPGEVYQVWWNNPVEDGARTWLHRWWSRDIAAFGDGQDVDVGVFEVADLILTQPCHDCAQTGSISFEWDARAGERGTYRWSMFDGCGDVEKRAEAWRSAPLNRQTRYVTGPPPGFQYDTRYCWYVLIEDGANGSGWPYFDRRVTFCSSAATCRGQATGRSNPPPPVRWADFGRARGWW